MADKMVRYQYMVLVNGCSMQHGPFDPTSAYHPRSAAAIYQEINPGALVVIQYRDNESDEGWTTNEPKRPKRSTMLTVVTPDDFPAASATHRFNPCDLYGMRVCWCGFGPEARIHNESNDSGVESTESVD
jgi:hypothetical protein